MAGETEQGSSEQLVHAREKSPGMHGRHADAPQQIPTPGWKDILVRVKDRVGRENISIIAAGVAFYAFLAIPSALTALVALYGLAFDPGDVQRQLGTISGMVPGDAMKLISQQLATITASPRSSLGVSFVIALLVAIWGARSGMSTMITALNIAYDEDEKRGFLRFQAAAFGLTSGAIVFAVVTLALIAVLPAVLGLLPFGNAGKTMAAVLRWPLLVALVGLGLAAIYRFAPSRHEAKWRWVSWGATVATILWLVGSALFSLYVSKFASYNKTYGSLGGVVVLMMWLYLSAFAVLLGAEINAEMERQTERDTTKGPEKPIGRRGATVADEKAW
jgi:membrane protein